MLLWHDGKAYTASLAYKSPDMPDSITRLTSSYLQADVSRIAKTRHGPPRERHSYIPDVKRATFFARFLCSKEGGHPVEQSEDRPGSSCGFHEKFSGEHIRSQKLDE